MLERDVNQAITSVQLIEPPLHLYLFHSRDGLRWFHEDIRDDEELGSWSWVLRISKEPQCYSGGLAEGAEEAVLRLINECSQ